MTISAEAMKPPAKAADADFMGRFREVISDPLNLLIRRVPAAGTVDGSEVYLHNGNRVPLEGAGAYYGGFSQILVLNRGVHEPLEEYVFQEVLKNLPESPFMIELGAYWAHYSMWLKAVQPHSTVIMIEPDPGCLAAGRSNFSRNGYQGEFIQAAVGKGWWEADAFFGSRGLVHVDVLHADIQGYEVEMLEGARTTLDRAAVDYLFISTHSQELHQQVVSRLGEHGYRVEVSSDFDNETTSYDGFVFASSPRATRVFGDFGFAGRTRIALSDANDLVEAVLKARRGSS